MKSRHVYELHVNGLLGPVLQSAVPELTVTSTGWFTILTGSVVDRSEVDGLMEKLNACGMTVTHIQLSPPEEGPHGAAYRNLVRQDLADRIGSTEIGGPDDGDVWSEPL